MASIAVVASLLIMVPAPTAVSAAGPIASSSFAGTENPLNENGAWVHMWSMSPEHIQFQKNNGAYAASWSSAHPNHPAARTTAAVPTDHYSEIVVGHIANRFSYVGPMVRVQTSGPAVDSQYTWWVSLAGGDNNWLYRFACNGTSYSAASLVPHSAVVDGDRLRLIARGPLLYGIKNGVREFIYNTGRDPIRYDGGTTGILSFVPNVPLTDATIASWSTGAAPASIGTSDSSTFAGTEDPLDEGDRWYPLPGFQGFRKAGVAIGKDGGHNVAGAWSIAPSAKQYSEITLGSAASGGGGAVVRIDRNNIGPTGWMLFLWVDNPTWSGIYKINPTGDPFTAVRIFNPITPTILPGDKWRLTADGNTLEVFRNGVSQFTYVTDGSYPTGDVGIETLSSAFTLSGWAGGETTSTPPAPPTISDFTPASGPVGTSVQINGSNFSGASSVTFNNVAATYAVSSPTVIQATVPSGAGSGRIGVTTAGGTATSTSNFTVTRPPPPARTISDSTAPTGLTTVAAPAGTVSSVSNYTATARPPTITSFPAALALVGTSVQINGTNFSGASAVTFGSKSATYAVSSPTLIQVTVPAGATTGPISVTTPGGTVSSVSNFTVTASPPTISGFAPASGPVGTSVQSNGTNFNEASSVTFNNVSPTYTVPTPTTIQATVPAAATTGPISVTTPGGTVNSAGAFRVVGAPTITGVTPTSAAVGTSVTIRGVDFTGATAVIFNTAGADFTMTSETAIQATVPAGATTGPVSVTTGVGTGTSATSFTVMATLSAQKAGNGGGTITSTSNPSNPTQINCGNTCSSAYPLGTVVTLTATPATGSNVTNWVGCDSVSGAVCTATVSAAQSVTATFTLQRFLVTVTKSSPLGVGNGTLTSTSSPASPTQIDCGPTCAVSFDFGTVVTLTVAPDVLAIFNGWDGCDTASGTTCTVNVTSARAVQAHFLP